MRPENRIGRRKRTRPSVHHPACPASAVDLSYTRVKPDRPRPTFARISRSEASGRVYRSMDWMMHVSVSFQDERLDFELPEERVVATWSAPVGLEPARAVEAIRDALETPWDFPPLRQMIVPGDRVVIALDSSISLAAPVLEVLGQTLRDAGVEPDGITVLTPAARPPAVDEAGIPAALWSFMMPGIGASLLISPRPRRAGGFI